MVFQPGAELLADIEELRLIVERCLQSLRTGHLPDDAERERVDLKEEAGRRGSGGVLLPARPRNTQAADHLADEVACMSNTPGGGALVVGVENATGDLLGTDLDVEWLRHEIYRRVDIAPVVEAVRERGFRLLVLFVPEALEPTSDTGDRLRWRVGSHCVPVDRSGWWLHRQGRIGWDPLARATRKTADDATPEALAIARRHLRGRATTDDDLADAKDTDLLRRLGVLTPDGYLTEAGALLFTPAGTSRLSWARLDVPGGDVLAAEDMAPHLSLLEQINRVETLIDAANDLVTFSGSFAERTVRLLPPRAAREAVLNGVVHRDWHQAEPTTVVWVETDSTLEVTSPGGFVGGVTAENVLTQRFSRSPALADAVRALGLVERQGVGVDRMYREMVSLGHQPPRLQEVAGPRVRVRLRGGQPVVPVMRLMDSIEPRVRQSDVQVAMIVHALLHDAFVTVGEVGRLIHRTLDEASEALEAAAECRVQAEPLITPLKDVWLLGVTARSVIRAGGKVDIMRRRGVLAYQRPDAQRSLRIVRSWFATHERMTSGDYAALTGVTVGAARQALERLVGEGILARGESTGRNAHFVLTVRPT
ncbi:MAG: DUF5635 domain-containing protein [Dermatophilaceae bacterium]